MVAIDLKHQVTAKEEDAKILTSGRRVLQRGLLYERFCVVVRYNVAETLHEELGTLAKSKKAKYNRQILQTAMLISFWFRSHPKLIR